MQCLINIIILSQIQFSLTALLSMVVDYISSILRILLLLVLQKSFLFSSVFSIETFCQVRMHGEMMQHLSQTEITFQQMISLFSCIVSPHPNLLELDTMQITNGVSQTLTGSFRVIYPSSFFLAMNYTQTESTRKECSKVLIGIMHRLLNPLYGTVCSGLTEKTKLSFIASNSSFNECVRNFSYIKYNIFNQKNDNPSCPSSQITSGRCTYYATRPYLSGSVSFLFTDTDFIRCEVTGDECFGGAIDCTSGDLTLQRCSFTKCYSEFRGGAVSFQGSGLCTQEDNLYAECWSDDSSGAFDSWDTSHNPHHSHTQCTYIKSNSTYYGHFAIEYSSDALIDSNIFICAYATGTDSWSAGNIVNFHPQGSIVYSNTLFCSGISINTGGVSFLGELKSDTTSLSVKFCFFVNNKNTVGPPYEIYFDEHTSCRAKRDLIIHSFSATSLTTVHIHNTNDADNNWLSQINIKIMLKRAQKAYTNKGLLHYKTY